VAADLFAMVESGKVKIDVNQRFPLADAAAGAHRARSAPDHRLDDPAAMREFSDDNEPQEPDTVGAPKFGRLLIVLLLAVLLIVAITFASEAYFR
jgi:hypothetical protein